MHKTNKFKNSIKKLLISTAVLVASSGSFLGLASAAINDQGVDWSRFQGSNGVFGYNSDKFTLIQIGGYNSSGIYPQDTYNSQVNSALAQGKRAHSYIWYEVGNSIQKSKYTLDTFLPQIKTPKKSIVALDYEAGAVATKFAGYDYLGRPYYVSTEPEKESNTNAVLYGMRRIKEAGYTPMYYSGKPYTLDHLNYEKIIKEFPGSLWISDYPDYNVTPYPNYNFFPSMDGIGIFQFTSTYIAGGLDGNIDLTGITDSGYKDGYVPKNSENVSPVNPTPSTNQGSSYTIKSGDTLGEIASKFSTSVSALQNLNGISNANLIFPGQVLKISGQAQVQVTSQNYTVKSGDTLGGIA